MGINDALRKFEKVETADVVYASDENYDELNHRMKCNPELVLKDQWRIDNMNNGRFTAGRAQWKAFISGKHFKFYFQLNFVFFCFFQKNVHYYN